MQAQLYPITNHIVKFALTVEKYDRIFYCRDRGDSSQKESTCSKCLATFQSRRYKRCPRCNSAPTEFIKSRRNGKLIARKIRSQLKTEFQHAPYGFPVNLEVMYLNAAETNKLDLDNILNVVMSIINGSIIFDDTLVHDIRIRYYTGNGSESQIVVTVSPWFDNKSKRSFTPADIAALFTLQDRFAGKKVYVPKNIQKLFIICEADIRAKLWPCFEKVVRTGTYYANVISLVKESDEDLKYLTQRFIIKEYRNWRKANG